MKTLPISAVIPDIQDALSRRDELVLEAPPGAGKTTSVPLVLLDQPWLGQQKILLLEPRKIAVKSAAVRLSENLSQPVGQRVGYKVHLEQKTSAATQIEVISDGILTRMLQSDPSLEGVGLIIFDEFHERSVTNDLNLALCMEGRALFRDEQPLKILIMSATLAGDKIAELLNNAPIVRSEGKSYPVALHYLQAKKSINKGYLALEKQIVDTIERALTEQEGNILVFLPGQREIHNVTKQLKTSPYNIDINILPLYGTLTFAQQQEAIRPNHSKQRNVILATNIAETSITIDGIRTVIDSGLCRRAYYDATSAMTRLKTMKISKASSEQRAGRAGRTTTGACYRLWTEEQNQTLERYTPAEILSADLSALALNLYQWGNDDLQSLTWLDPPKTSAFNRATTLLESLGALQKTSTKVTITEHGKAMCRLPVDPRLSHLTLTACQYGLQKLGCDISALLSEKDPLVERQSDLMLRLDWLHKGPSKGSSDNSSRLAHQRIKQQSHIFSKQCNLTTVAIIEDLANTLSLAQQVSLLIASTWPERIAQLTQREQLFKLANGRLASLPKHDYLSKSNYLCVASCSGSNDDKYDQIRLSCQLDIHLISRYLPHLINPKPHNSWESSNDRFITEKHIYCGKICLDREHNAQLSIEDKRTLILTTIQQQGLNLLHWTAKARALQARISFLYRHCDQSSGWPNVSDEHLHDTLDHWLGPQLTDNIVKNCKGFKGSMSLDLHQILLSLLPWPLPQQLDVEAPVKYKVPSGSMINIDYSQQPPVLAVKLQEMFGCISTPNIATKCQLKQGGKGISLQIQLLSPAGRPLQITQDLASFWQNSYPEVKKEMKGRYPKHPWPDDPLIAVATNKTKRKLSSTP